MLIEDCYFSFKYVLSAPLEDESIFVRHDGLSIELPLGVA